MGGEEDQIGGGEVADQIDGCRKAPVERGHRRGPQPRKDEALAGGGDFDHGRGHRLAGVEDQRLVRTVRPHKAQGQRDREGLLVRLAGRGGRDLGDIQRQRAAGGIIARLRGQPRGAGLGIPEAERPEIAPGGLGEAGEEILDGRRIAVVPGKIQVHAGAEARLAQQGFQHPHHLGALLIDGGGVEVVDFAIGFRPHGVRQRAGILGELLRLQQPHIRNPLDRAGALVRGEFLVAEDGEAFLQAELEPVPAGDAVSGPVVEIFMGDDRLDIGVVRVGGGLRSGEDIFVVEDVQSLVLHRPHVEVGNGDDVEDIQIVFAAEHLFVPAHGTLQRVHGIAGAVLLAGLHIDAEIHRGARRR